MAKLDTIFFRSSFLAGAISVAALVMINPSRIPHFVSAESKPFISMVESGARSFLDIMSHPNCNVTVRSGAGEFAFNQHIKDPSHSLSLWCIHDEEPVNCLIQSFWLDAKVSMIVDISGQEYSPFCPKEEKLLELAEQISRRQCVQRVIMSTIYFHSLAPAKHSDDWLPDPVFYTLVPPAYKSYSTSGYFSLPSIFGYDIISDNDVQFTGYVQIFGGTLNDLVSLANTAKSACIRLGTATIRDVIKQVNVYRYGASRLFSSKLLRHHKFHFFSNSLTNVVRYLRDLLGDEEFSRDASNALQAISKLVNPDSTFFYQVLENTKTLPQFLNDVKECSHSVMMQKKL